MIAQKTQKTTEPARYSYSAPVTIRARMHNTGRVRTGRLIQVANETSGAVYSVILEDDGRARCTCPHYTKRLAGTNRTCKHIDGSRVALIEQAMRQEWQRRGEAVITPSETPAADAFRTRHEQALRDRETLWS